MSHEHVPTNKIDLRGVDLVNLEPTPDSFIPPLYVAIDDFVDIRELQQKCR